MGKKSLPEKKVRRWREGIEATLDTQRTHKRFAWNWFREALRDYREAVAAQDIAREIVALIQIRRATDYIARWAPLWCLIDAVAADALAALAMAEKTRPSRGKTQTKPGGSASGRGGKSSVNKRRR